jgi:LysB family phage lysis regulatory protein
MNELAGRLVCGLLVAILALSGASYVRRLQNELATSQAAAETAQQGIANRDADLKTLREGQKAKDAARAKLEGERDALRLMLSNRETLIRNLEDENPVIRAWSDAPVPGDIVRLREHPAYAGAANYRDGLRGRQPLHAAGSGGPN